MTTTLVPTRSQSNLTLLSEYIPSTTHARSGDIETAADVTSSPKCLNSPKLPPLEWIPDFTSQLRGAQKSVVPGKRNEDRKLGDVDINSKLLENHANATLGYVAIGKESLTTRIESTTNPRAVVQESPFLTLPYEIRYQIYLLLLESHTAHHVHLAPEPPFAPEKAPPLNLQPQGFGLPAALSSSSLPRWHSRFHPRGKIPSSFLRSCKQIYAETHKLPFEKDEFTFVNWFRSGNYAASEFTRGLLPWQREAMRYVAVDVLARDLAPKYKRKGDWESLCSLWTGVGGLRLGIKGAVEIPHAVEGNVLDPDLPWVTHGLSKMRALRWVELEIQDHVARDVKLEFRHALQRRINGDRRPDEFVEIYLCGMAA